MTNKNTICRVCGFDYTNYYKDFKNYYSEDLNFYPWSKSGVTPSYGYCCCCSVEFGNQDDGIEWIRGTRQEWIDAGMPWDMKNLNTSAENKPPDYDPIKQMKNIPKEFL